MSSGIVWNPGPGISIGDTSSSGHKVSIEVDSSGVGEYARSTANASIGVGTDWSIMAWGLNTTSAGSATIFTFKEDATNDNLFVLNRFDVTTDIRFRNRSTSGVVLTDKRWTSRWVIGEWVHVVATWSNTGSTDQMFIDGVLTSPDVTSVDIAGVMGASNRIIAIGNAETEDNAWDGNIYQCAIWDTILSQNAVTAIYSNGAPAIIDLNTNFGNYTFASNLKFWFKLGQTSNNIAKNYAASPPSTLTFALTNLTEADVVSNYPTGS